MSKSGGYISCDPRFGLVESGACDRISFTTDLDFPFSLPYRINVDSKQNLHLPLFSMVGNKFDYTWTYYADGTWSRVPGKNPTSLDNSYRWEELSKANGFPTDFKMCKDCDKWVSENHDRFLWDPSQRVYVYRAPAAQTQPVSSS